MNRLHTFHIPVMGIGFTLETPLKVSHYGIDSAISLVDDGLLEKLRKMYCAIFEMSYTEISDQQEDYRAERITSYLNMINSLTARKFEEFKKSASEKSNELKAYFSLLPDTASIKEEFKKFTDKYFNIGELKSWISENMAVGSIDVNIMTKVDRPNFKHGKKLPAEYNDAHAALRGYAQSDLSSSVILSAGMNPRLYSYLENFEDFYPNKKGEIRKKITLKVSDYRSAQIQGKFLARKGLWVSEFRVESGLNCGGHAFATEGFLLGPILEVFKGQREELERENFEILSQSLSEKNREIPDEPLTIKITAQGGVGTAEEHRFLLDYYQVDSVGWGTPFLLVPEATSVDELTLAKLAKAKENDVYLSNISPLGVPFNSLRSNSKDVEKTILIGSGKPGSLCPKQYVAINYEFNEKGLCTASRLYQKKKIQALQEETNPPEMYKEKYAQIVEKSCICVGLGTAALLVNHLDTVVEGPGVSVCPGPNIAYFQKIMSLQEITGHIYGRNNCIERTDRPNMFIKELGIYIDFLMERMAETKAALTAKQAQYFSNFSENLHGGINYYEALFSGLNGWFEETKAAMLLELKARRQELRLIMVEKQTHTFH
ncbi:MAG: hypothetical protein KGZ82_13815 [Bacteroidales bacterium]|nr:hypothetical protein [Bacteroidales bacterium]